MQNDQEFEEYLNNYELGIFFNNGRLYPQLLFF